MMTTLYIGSPERKRQKHLKWNNLYRSTEKQSSNIFCNGRFVWEDPGTIRDKNVVAYICTVMIGYKTPVVYKKEINAFTTAETSLLYSNGMASFDFFQPHSLDGPYSNYTRTLKICSIEYCSSFQLPSVFNNEEILLLRKTNPYMLVMDQSCGNQG